MTVAIADRIEALIDHDPIVVEGFVREIAADGGTWEFSIPFDVKEIAASLKVEGKPEADAAPMFVEVLVMHEGFSKKTDGTNNIHYVEQAVKDTARMLPGRLGYLGHQEPGKEEFEYRTPVTKYVASRTEKRDVKDVGNVLCVIGKAYVSAAAKDFRTHLREKMAGPVSISGTALFKANRGVRTNETVGMARLGSVDFCNPGTPGIAGAGVTGVVREIAGTKPNGSSTMSEAAAAATRLSRADIQRDYPEVVQVIIGEETASLNKTLGEVREQKKAAEDRATKAEGEVTTLTGKVNEMTKAHGEATKRAETAEASVKEMRAQVRLGAVKDALVKEIDGRIETAKKGKDAATEVPVLEMARKRLTLGVDVLVESDDKDNTLSVKAAGAKFDAAVGEVREMAKAFGAPKAGSVREMAAGGTKATSHEGGGDDEAAERRRLLPGLAKRLTREEKAAAGK